MKNLKLAAVFLAIIFLLGGCKSLLEEFLSSEAPADVANPVTIDREAFSLDHPGNWKVDTEDEDYDPDHLFFIESPGNCFVMISIWDSLTNPEKNVQAQVNEFSKLIEDEKKSEFKKWGSYTGSGALLTGKIMMIDGRVKIFSSTTRKRSFLALEQCFDEDMENVQPGFDLIEKTFKLKK